jgi:hypothetical protein
VAGKLERVAVVTPFLEIWNEADAPQRGVAVATMDEKQRRSGVWITGGVVVNDRGLCGHLDILRTQANAKRLLSAVAQLSSGKGVER